MAAIAAAVALHAGALLLRPGVSGGQVTAHSVASVLAVRIVPATGEATPRRETESLPSTPPIAADAREPVPATKPLARAPADPAPAPTPQQKSESREAAPARSPSRPEPAAPATPALAAAPEYALGIQLDPGPRPLDEIDPDYPDPVRLRTGTVVLRLLISEAGHVDDASVVRAEPEGVFDRAAIEAFTKARFSPGILAGRPVKSQIRVEVEFMPINRGGRVSGRSY